MTRRLETQSADLRFVASQYAHRVEAEQKKVETVKRKAEEVFIKFGVFKERTGDGDVTFDVSGTDGRVKPRPRATTAPVPKGHAPPNEQTAEEVYERIQKFDIETGLEPQDNDAAHIPAFPYPDPVVADLVALSEKRIQALLKEMELVSAKNGELETELDVLRKQMISRNQEIARLGTQLEIACAQQFSSVQFKSTAGATNAKQHVIQDLDAARQRIAQLEAQSDLFHEHVEALEKEIAAHEDDKKALYKSFETEKKDILAQLQKERQRFSAPLPRSPSPNKAARNSKTDREDLRSSLRSPTKGATIDSVMGSTRTVNSEASGVGSLRAELEALRAENERLQASLSATARPEAVDQFANNPPSSSTATAAVTTAAEKLHAELGKLKIENATLKGRASELEAQKWALENDLKGMKHKLERAHALEKDLEATRARAQDFQRKAQDRLAECEPLRESLARAVYEQKESTERLNQLQQQYQTVSHERDELIVVLQHFEEQLSEVQRCIEAVTNDRDNIAALYEQVNEELQLFRRIHPADLSTPVGQQPPPRPTAPPEPSAPTMSPVRNTAADVAQSTGNENADLRAAQATIQHLQGEIEILQRDLQATVVRHREGGESTSDAVQRLEDEVDRLRRELRAREGERDAIKSQWQDAQRNAEAAQRAVADLQREEAALRMDIVDLKANEDREAYTARGLRSKVADMEARLARSTTECERFCKESETKTRQIQEQKALFMEIDRQRDRDRDEMDRKCERIVELEQLVEKAEAAAVNAQQEADTLHDQIQSMKEHLNEREGQISVLRQNLNKATQDRDRWAAECKRLTEEASNVGSDLGAVSKENQRLNALLEETTNERERFKAELMESESQIKQLDDLLLAKDQEREHLMAAYRKLVGEHERLDTSVKMAGEESSNMRMEMVVRDKRVMALQQALDETSADLTKAKLDLAAHEKQAANAARALAANARNVANLQADKARLVRDVAASRDLAASIDRQRDDLQKRLTAAALDVERLSKALQKADTDRETLQAEMQAEKVKAERLEHLVAVERTRKIQTEKAAQDFTKSKESLEDQLNRVNQQQKISIQAMTREIKDLEVERDHWKERVQQTERSLREQQKSKRRMLWKLETIKVTHNDCACFVFS
ncbi:uncharacterized protein EV422DRAFT_109288 [Fimicolochytrium jonesii]|uniref:uncharacterized protein n=1 Tax=Fimicolochytrium jonesii TaxID=1396493 RepID=UPI0022FEDD1E|nr:uncharacterized protein EV422DRAFT_109288 [Fimicolochytrium jonesii]KAI8819353.1 hypothetical protein EV422DRAFT_109288 [Fimicolochytrium jonesii]